MLTKAAEKRGSRLQDLQFRYFWFLQLFVWLWLELRIGDASVVDDFETILHGRFGNGDVAKGDVALVEEPLAHLSIDNLIDNTANTVLGVFLQGT